MSALLLTIQMAGIGDYIFLIVILISVVSQLIGKNKKELADSNDQPASPRKRHPFDEEEYGQPSVFPMPFDPFEVEDKIPAEEGTPAVKGRQPVKPAARKSAKQEREMEAMARQYTARQIAEMENRIKEGQRGIYDKIKEGDLTTAEPRRQKVKFNLKQAVIQTEILNRKYS